MKLTGSHGGRRLTRSVTLAVILLLAVVTLSFSYRTWLHPAAPQPAGGEVALFSDVTDTIGLQFVHHAGGAHQYFMPAIMAGGVALLDFDLDGDLDIFFVNGAGVHSGSVVPSEGHRNVLYRQEADGRFVDVTVDCGLGGRGYGMGVAVGDVNNDGYPDVYVTNYGPDRLYLNRGDGTFVDVTESAGIDNIRWGTSVCFVDVDRDGWLDLFVTNYINYDPARKCLDTLGRISDFCGPHLFAGTSDILYRNETGRALENGVQRMGERLMPHFVDVSLSAGIAEQPGPGLGVICADFNGDHWPDIYVANDLKPNFLWINQQTGQFRDEAVLRGCAFDRNGMAQSSMGMALGDVDGNATFDLFITNFARESNTLYLGIDSGACREDGVASGLGLPSLPYTGFGTAFLDVDHDGDLDVVTVGGRVSRPSSLERSEGKPAAGSAANHDFWSDYAERNQILLNDGRGRFREFLSPSEPFTAEAAVSRGLAIGDVDNDGDVDILVVNTAGRAKIYFNIAQKNGTWLQVRVVDPELGGRDAYGALVTVVAGERRLSQWANPGFSYLASCDPRLHFGLGQTDAVDRIEVLWPNGTKESFEGGTVNRLRVLERGEGHSP